MVKKWNWITFLKNAGKIGISLLAAGSITKDTELAALLTLTLTLLLNSLEFYIKRKGA